MPPEKPLGNPGKKRRRNSRRRKAIWTLHDFKAGHGLEIGPLTRPIVMHHEAAVEYVDVLDTAGLRAHYAGDKDVPPDKIQEVDYHLIQADGTMLSLVEATRAGAPFDWVMASHVIEHVPDVIGWLDQIAQVTIDGGVLVLVIPDRRYCFDVIRPPTSVGQMLEANKQGHTVPSARAVYDYFSSVVDYKLPDLWQGKLPNYGRRLYSSTAALAQAERVKAGEYVDCHVWLWTPESFRDQLRELRRAGLSSWYVEQCTQTPTDDLEFKVVLRRISRDDPDPTRDLQDELAPELERPEWAEERMTAASVQELTHRTEELEKELAQRTEELAAVLGSRRYRIGSRVADLASLPQSIRRR